MKKEIRERIEKIGKGEVPEGYKKTKVGIIPVEWKVIKLKEIGSFSKGKGISKSDVINCGKGCVRYGEIYTSHHVFIKNFKSFISDEDASNSKLISKGDILFAGSGETAEEIGKAVCYMMDDEAYAGGDIIILSPKNKNNYFYGYVLNHNLVNKQTRIKGQGQSVVHIYSKDLESVRIPKPFNYEENKIAEILSTWDKAIELKEKLIEEKKVQKENNLRNIFSEKFLKNNFEIKKIQLKDILKQVKEIHYIEEDKLYRQVTISKNGKVSFRGEKPGNKIGRKRQFKINLDKHPESLIFIRQGVLNGGIGIIPKEVNCCVVTENMPMFRIVDIDVTYLKWLIKSPLFRNRIKKIIPDGTAQKAIHEKVLLLESFIIPKDIKDQKIIANIVSLQFNEIELLESELEQTKEQKRGLMQLLLTGIVRVEVD